MASTYSTNLGIELIGSGEQSGTWGATTNNNLGTLLEQAISGYVTQAVSTGADTTITIPNGASGVARNMYIELTGTAGANTNLIVPANEKLYLIFNNTASGAVTVKVSGQTGVSVPNAAKMFLVNTGAGAEYIVSAVSYFAALSTGAITAASLSTGAITAASLTLTTPLAVTSGGTGSATVTANNAIVGNSGGTGFTSVAPSTSGFVLSSNGTAWVSAAVSVTTVTGTLPIANGGTAATTAAGARTSLGLGTMATQASSAVSITGGSITGVTATLTTPLDVASGGTGASSITANNVLIANSGGTAVTSVAPSTSGNVLTSNGTAWTSAQGFVSGMIMMWSGSVASIPSGWYLCNGANSTPDLRDRMVIGAGSTYAVNATGGSATTTLITANLASHTHTYSSTSGNTSVDHNHTYSGTTSGQSVTHNHSQFDSNGGPPSGHLTGLTIDSVNDGNVYLNTATTGNASVDHNHTYSGTSAGANVTHTHSVSGTSDATGSGTAATTISPYYALAYIMKS